MKAEEKQKARQMRLDGMSLGDIQRELNVSKSTVSLWVRDIQLSQEKIDELNSRNNREKYLETIRLRRIERTRKVNKIADVEYEELSKNANFVFGLAIYIGEGSKRSEYRVEITNCDPRVIRKAIKFYEIIGIPKQNIDATIHIHHDCDLEKAILFWKEQTNLKAQQFKKSIVVVSKSSSGKKINYQPYGTCHIGVNSADIKRKLLRWIDLSLR